MKRMGLLLTLILLLSGCSAKETEPAPELMEPVGASQDTTVVVKKEISERQSLNGKVTPERAELSFTMDGNLDTLYVAVGDKVKKGDLLAELDKETLTEQIEELTDRIADAKKDNAYVNQQLQYDILISEAERGKAGAEGADESALALKALDVEEKRLAFAQAQESQALSLKQMNAQLKRLKERLETNKILAPRDGTVTYVDEKMKEGAPISAYDPVIYLADESSLSILAENVSQSTVEHAYEIGALIRGKRYKVTMEPYDMSTYVSIVSAGGTPFSRFQFDKIDDSVQAGDYAAIIVTTSHVDDALVIPSGALYHEDRTAYVYKIVNGKRERHNVKTGLITSVEIQITEGLEEGDVVYVQG